MKSRVVLRPFLLRTVYRKETHAFRMFVQSAFSGRWPASSFLPWFLLSGAYRLTWMFRKRVLHPWFGARVSRPKGTGLSISGLSLLLAAAPLAFADPVVGEHQSCPVSTAQAHSLADRLYEQGSYQPAGACYLAAGDYDRANRAFVKASDRRVRVRHVNCLSRESRRKRCCTTFRSPSHLTIENTLI
jgi:hypothetical protein